MTFIEELTWQDVTKKPPEGVRILVFSPVYPFGKTMRFRLMDSEFLGTLTDATYWAELQGPDF